MSRNFLEARVRLARRCPHGYVLEIASIVCRVCIKSARVKERRARTRAEQKGVVKLSPTWIKRSKEIMAKDGEGSMAKKKAKKKGGGGPVVVVRPEGRMFLLPKRDNPIEMPKVPPKLEGRAPRARDDEEV